MRKLILSLFLICCISYVQSENATLQFPLNTKVSYTLTQDADGQVEIFEDVSKFESHAKVDFDITLKEGSNYPYIVELTFKKIKVKEMIKDDGSVKKTSFDSTKNSKSEIDFLKKLIDHPLYFTVDSEFKVKETSGFLEAVLPKENDDEDDELIESVELLAISPSTFELFFTQLFHLSGKELSTNSHPKVLLYPIANWNDDPIDTTDLKIEEDSKYHILSIDHQNINGEWIGKCRLSDEELTGKLKVFGTVSWNAQNALLQQRESTINVKEEHKGIIPIGAKVTIKQTWTSTLAE